MVAVDGAIHARCAIGDTAEPAQLHQRKVVFLKTLGSSSMTNGFWSQIFLSAIVHLDGVRLKTQRLVVLTAVAILTGTL